jgi:uncharacterized protein (TIGR02301 family)
LAFAFFLAAVPSVALAAAGGTAKPAAPAPVHPSQPAQAPYEGGLMRLAEILGSLHFLRNLCGEPGSDWRDEMQKLIDAENPDADRKARFVASFNRGYRAFQGSYGSCTASATEAIRRYTAEGETLSREIATRYGN